VAVAGVNAGTGTADAGPSSASKPIEEIQVGDFVWARAEHDPSAPAVLQKVVALYRNTAHDLQTLEVVGELGSAEPLGQSVQIVATDEHPFYVVDVGWTTADAVQVGQKLVGAGGAVLTVVANRDWKPDGGVVVYNFQVEGDHTYFVGDIHAQGEWVWTHNACDAFHHFAPRAWGSDVPYGATYLKRLDASEHTLVHQGFSSFLKQRTGHYFNSMSGSEWQSMLDFRTRRSLLIEFHRTFAGGAYWGDFTKEVIRARRAGYNPWGP
jgi:hypothetical protein